MTSYLDPGQPLLDGRFPLPLDEPFTAATAARAGLSANRLTALTAQGYLRRVLSGVYCAAQLADSLDVRVAALRLVVPDGAVVTDRTAAWLHGVPYALAPGDHHVVPRVSSFHRARGCRVRRASVASGQRMMPDLDVTVVGGVAVTTLLRTACDLGRLLPRDGAIAALDMMLRHGLGQDELLLAVDRFKGYRGVRQLRRLAPLADGRAQSPPESVLRLRWLDCPGMPRPEPQRPVPAPGGGCYWLDLGVDDLRFAVEYDGEAFHGPDRAHRDGERRQWIRDQGWFVGVVEREQLFGSRNRFDDLLRRWLVDARRGLGDVRR